MTSATLSFVDERQVLTVIWPMLHLCECADPAPAESAAEPLDSIGDSTTIEQSAIEPLHSIADPAANESTTKPLQSVADSDAAADAPIETSSS
jgi:hypothetical protein